MYQQYQQETRTLCYELSRTVHRKKLNVNIKNIKKLDTNRYSTFLLETATLARSTSPVAVIWGRTNWLAYICVHMLAWLSLSVSGSEFASKRAYACLKNIWSNGGIKFIKAFSLTADFWNNFEKIWAFDEKWKSVFIYCVHEKEKYYIFTPLRSPYIKRVMRKWSHFVFLFLNSRVIVKFCSFISKC